MARFTMPSLGADMTEGTLVEWLVEPGAHVSKGDIVAVVDTTKSAIEVECFESGVVDRLLVEPGATVPVGTALAEISTAGDGRAGPAAGAPSRGPERPAAASGHREETPAPPADATSGSGAPGAAAPGSAAAEGGEGVTTTPLVRHLADEAGVDLAALRGTGPGGRITRGDVEGSAAAAPAPAHGGPPGAAHRRVRATPKARRAAADAGLDLAAVTGTGRDGAIRLADVRAALAGGRGPTGATGTPAGPAVSGARHAADGGPEKARARGGTAATGTAATAGTDAGRLAAMRATTAELMARSKREVPHYYLSTTVDLGEAVAWLRERNRELPVADRLVTTAVLLKATALAARRVPRLNGFWTGDGFRGESAVHLGVAVSLRGGGLVAPALRDAADLPLTEVMARLRDIVARARTGRLRSSETNSATITVTNLGDQGVEAVFGVIHPPQVALVGLGKVVERPWAVNGLLGVRPVVTATLSADHRATDGATGARFLAALDDLAQKPEEL